MADIDLKTEAPDTSLPTTGFLFGADSQAASSPSVYTTQSVATTLLGSTTLSGTTLTANAPVLNLSQTWNNAGVTFTGLQFNATDTASNAVSLLMDLQVGGSSKVSVRKDGRISGDGANPYVLLSQSNGGEIGWGASYFRIGNGNSRFFNGVNVTLFVSSEFLTVSNGVALSWSSTSSAASGQDLFITRRGAANLRLGAADAAAPVAQTLSVQSVVAGTTNTAGANFTITGSQGTGTGAGGSIIFQTSRAGSSGTAQNALVNAVTIAGTGITTFNEPIVVPQNITTSGGGSIRFGTSTCFFAHTLGSDTIIVAGLGASSQLVGGGFSAGSTSAIGFSSNVNSWVGTRDIFLTRRAAANLRFGDFDNATPVAQTLSVQSVVAGTTNGAGADFTITGSQGTGSGAGGSIIFQVAPAGSSGTAQNALATALTIGGDLNVTLNNLGLSQSIIGPGNSGRFTFSPVNAALNYGGVNNTAGIALISPNAGINTNLVVHSVGSIGFSSTSSANTAMDTILVRDAANTLALRNGTNAQTFRVYGTFTDASNYRRLTQTMSTAGVAEIKPEGAGTGASGNVLHISGLPTSNPGPGILWNNAGTPAIGT